MCAGEDRLLLKTTVINVDRTCYTYNEIELFELGIMHGSYEEVGNNGEMAFEVGEREG